MKDKLDETGVALKVIHELANERWDVCLTLSEKGFQQISFVNCYFQFGLLSLFTIFMSDFPEICSCIIVPITQDMIIIYLIIWI